MLFFSCCKLTKNNAKKNVTAKYGKKLDCLSYKIVYSKYKFQTFKPNCGVVLLKMKSPTYRHKNLSIHCDILLF